MSEIFPEKSVELDVDAELMSFDDTGAFTEEDREKLDVVYAFCKGMADMMEQVQQNPMAKNMLTSMGMTVGRFANGR